MRSPLKSTPQTEDVDLSDLDKLDEFEKMDEFISLSGGMEYIRWTEIVGMRWKQYVSVDGDLVWRLEVYFSECPSMFVYGDDARAVMRFFDLPEEPPTDMCHV